MSIENSMRIRPAIVGRSRTDEHPADSSGTMMKEVDGSDKSSTAKQIEAVPAAAAAIAALPKKRCEHKRRERERERSRDHTAFSIFRPGRRCCYGETRCSYCTELYDLILPSVHFSDGCAVKSGYGKTMWTGTARHRRDVQGVGFSQGW